MPIFLGNHLKIAALETKCTLRVVLRNNVLLRIVKFVYKLVLVINAKKDIMFITIPQQEFKHVRLVLMKTVPNAIIIMDIVDNVLMDMR